jgi:GNAT superfamily N-acetyltransferase
MLITMTTVRRTTSEDPNFHYLVSLLDRYLKIRNGEDDSFFAQFNKIDAISNVVVCYVVDKAVGCGAFKPYESGAVEIKRMFVLPDFRGQGIATSILTALERWAFELGYSACVLETGSDMLDAVGLYRKAGYEVIPNYGQYAGVKGSMCMRKDVVQTKPTRSGDGYRNP